MKQAAPIFKAFKGYLTDDRGATAIEYGLIAALIGVGIIGGLNAFGDSQTGVWGGIASSVDNAIG